MSALPQIPLLWGWRSLKISPLCTVNTDWIHTPITSYPAVPSAPSHIHHCCYPCPLFALLTLSSPMLLPAHSQWDLTTSSALYSSLTQNISLWPSEVAFSSSRYFHGHGTGDFGRSERLRLCLSYACMHFKCLQHC